jgi:hypothetical protein
VTTAGASTTSSARCRSASGTSGRSFEDRCVLPSSERPRVAPRSPAPSGAPSTVRPESIGTSPVRRRRPHSPLRLRRRGAQLLPAEEAEETRKPLPAQARGPAS